MPLIKGGVCDVADIINSEPQNFKNFKEEKFMSMTIANEKFIRFSEENKKAEVIAEIYVDTADELPSRNSLDNKILHQGSAAFIINKDIIALMNSNGEWRNAISGEAIV